MLICWLGLMAPVGAATPTKENPQLSHPINNPPITETNKSPNPAAQIDFIRDVQPILSENCYPCHGPEKQRSGLRLDRKDDALRGGDSGKIIVPGNSHDSLLFRYVAGLDSDKLMPPRKNGRKPLATNQVAYLRAWIDSGAPWPEESQIANRKSQIPKHWAFIPPVPAIPEVRNHRWVRNPIDAFVLARLEAEHIKPSPEANRVTLIRRLSLDLLGLPPTPDEVHAFLKDDRPAAYDDLVERLLRSPHFGERWGRHWLDLARYADSAGYQLDHERPYAYVYRDWVIDAINRDLPFDQFTVEQLAGDLLPNATLEQKVATGFHRNTLMNHEDGVDKEEFRCKAKVDRVATTGTVWLGLTVGCAECHSHKYDPISQREFYQLYAFFNRAEETDIPLAQSGKKHAQAQTFTECKDAVKTFVHIRGDFLRPGDEVQPGILSALHPFKPRSPTAQNCTNNNAQPDRLDLARWLVDPANPLTSRVAVNRIWQQLFGRGLVNTPEDFGTRGEPPSHPQLLDWLATEFIARGWSRKAMIKLIVTSAAYRQSSQLRRDLAEHDPLNVLLARQNRLRLESEIIRDVSLAAAGLLNPEIGGPSFRPPTTDYFKRLGKAGAFTWVDSEGPAKYRRGLYIFAQRTVPYSVGMTFDQANPSETCTRRERSTTPLQALTLLNNPVFAECAHGLGLRMLNDQARDPRQKIEHSFELCLARKPARSELARLEKLYKDERQIVSKNSAAAAKLIGEAPRDTAQAVEAASLITVAQVMLNLDEFITRE